MYGNRGVTRPRYECSVGWTRAEHCNCASQALHKTGGATPDQVNVPIVHDHAQAYTLAVAVSHTPSPIGLDAWDVMVLGQGVVNQTGRAQKG